MEQRGKMLRLAEKAWTALPWDGQGVAAPADADLARLRAAAAARFWRRLPWWSRPVLRPAARLAWLVAACLRVARFAGTRRLPAATALRLLADCALGGGRPVDSWAWRAHLASGPHPLPHRAAAAVLHALAEPSALAVLRDKQATADLLRSAGIPTPPVLALLPPGAAIDPRQPPWNRPAALFVKPRSGAAGRGAMAVDLLEDGRCRLADGTLVDARRLAPEGDDMLVQARLSAAPELADLAMAGAAPVLRLTTARTPGGAPFLHSALLSVAVPGAPARAFLRGHLWAAVAPASGELTAGLILCEPGRRYHRLPWNGAALAGRTLPGFAEAAALSLRAMEALPSLPLVAWEAILTADGPVFLEGNGIGNWLLTNLPIACGLAPPSLPPVLRKWLAE